MNKKILIASIFATFMLMLPMTSVVGVSDVSLNRLIEKIEDNNTITETYDNEDCGCQDVKFEIISTKIATLSEMNEGLKLNYSLNGNFLICLYLNIMFGISSNIWFNNVILSEIFINFPKLSDYFSQKARYWGGISFWYSELMWDYDCYGYPDRMLY